MPFEKPPTNPLPKGPRSGRPHRVADNESLESVADKYGVPVKTLLLHNFGTLHPMEINWYLHHQVGCNLPTHDRKNWRFSRAANPGIIYIPDKPQVVRMDPILIAGDGVAGQRVDLSLPFPLDMLASSKFTHEFKLPKTEIGYFLIETKIAVEGELKQQGGTVKVSLKKDQVKAAIETKLSDNTKATFGMKFEEKTMGPILEAVKKRSVADFTKALFSAVDVSIKTSQLYKFGKLSLVPEAGLELSTTPLLVRLSGEYEDVLPIDGGMFKGKFVLNGEFHVGLSKAGWAWISERIGAEAVKDFLMGAGERALTAIGEWLLAEGVLVGGAVAIGALIGTLGVASLTAWICNDARHKGELQGLATWYVSAYSAKVFREERPSGFIVGDTKLRDQLIVMGEKDAVQDARAVLTKLNNPAARGSDEQALEAFRQMLVAADKGSWSTARWRLQQSLGEKSRKLVGL